MGRAPGDPSTPGFPSPAPGTESTPPRLSEEEWDARLPRIPCTPIPAREAAAILERLASKRLTKPDGTKASTKVGPGPVEVRLVVDAPREVRTIRNVIGRLHGESEDVVIAGNHRDAWVRGANDAGGGTVALLRAAQRLGERAKRGWKPRHTIALAFWDAEEQGLIGSTEWGEANADWLREHAIAYVNADSAVSGTRFGASGTPGLLGTLERVLGRVPAHDPAREGAPRTLWQEWSEASEDGPQLGLPGSGSDFAVFLHHLSLPVLDFSFSGNRGGQYHTAFDDFLQVEDSDFHKEAVNLAGNTRGNPTSPG
jgi:N-acetylated-alpha-linked acidic dipeptidase